jgi:23S rRNA (cytosine1962-C5)-methyltransferase
MGFKELRLNKNQDRRISAGHLWIYSNEVDTQKTPLKLFNAGEQVNVFSAAGRPLGTAYINPHTLLCARLINHDRNTVMDDAFFAERIRTALRLRERLFQLPYYRLVFGESDRLPGLIVDRFDSTLVVQITTAGMQNVAHLIVQGLVDVLSPACILMANDTAMRDVEQLSRESSCVYGSLPEQLSVVENDCRFHAPPLTGQKTGWFFDHRLNRSRMQHYARQKRVLDVFSYIGGWSIQAAVAGAAQVHCIESSRLACDYLEQNAQLNNVAQTMRSLQGDAFSLMTDLRQQNTLYDLVITDPPAFIKRKKDLDQGQQAYLRLNTLAMQLLTSDGILVSASCSFHFPPQEHLRTLLKASQKTKRHIQVLEQGHQGPDHPVHPAIQETNYLSTFIVRVI